MHPFLPLLATEVVYFVYLGTTEILWSINKKLKVIFLGAYAHKDIEPHRKKYVSSVRHFGNVSAMNASLLLLQSEIENIIQFYPEN